jgi:hypothetical protein
MKLPLGRFALAVSIVSLLLLTLVVPPSPARTWAQCACYGVMAVVFLSAGLDQRTARYLRAFGVLMLVGAVGKGLGDGMGFRPAWFDLATTVAMGLTTAWIVYEVMRLRRSLRPPASQAN